MKYILTALILGVVAAVAGEQRASFEDGRETYERGLKAYATTPIEAYNLFIRAVGEGSIEAMMAAGHCCEYGIGIVEDRRTAYVWYSKAIQLNPVRACRGLAAINTINADARQGELRERLAEFETYGHSAAEAYEYAIQLLKDGKQVDAEDILEHAITTYPSDARLLFARGVMSRSRWDKFSAMMYFSGVQKLDASSDWATAAGAAIAMDMGNDITAGFSSLRNLRREHPDEPFYAWLFAIQCREQNRYPEGGATAYEEILEVWNPGPVMIRHTYANLLTENLGRAEDALKHRRIALQQAERSWTCQGLANTLNSLKRYEEAEPYYARASELDAADPKHWRQWGLCLMKLERYNKAADTFRKAIALSPSDVNAQTHLGESLIELGKYSEARNIFDDVLKEAPNTPAVLRGLATLYDEGLGVDKDEEKAADYKELEKEARLQIFEKSRPDIKLAAPPSVSEFDQGSALGCLTIANAYYNGDSGAQVDYIQAASYYKKAIEFGSYSAAYNLGRLYTDGGYGLARNLPVALEWHEWLIHLDPGKLESKDSRVAQAMLEAARISSGYYGAAGIDAVRATEYSQRVYDEDPRSENKMLVARATAINGKFKEAAGLMQELVNDAQTYGHIRGLEKKKVLLGLYREGKLYERETGTADPEGNSQVALRPADLIQQEITDEMRRPAFVRGSRNSPSAVGTQNSLFQEANSYFSPRNAGKRDYKQALELFLKSYESELRYKGLAAFSIGRIYARGGHGLDQDPEQAIVWFNRAIDEGREEGYTGLIDLYLSPRDPAVRNSDKALEYATVLHTAEPEKASSFLSMAKAYGQAGKFDEAVTFQQEAIRRYNMPGTISEGFLRSLNRDLEKYRQREKSYR